MAESSHDAVALGRAIAAARSEQGVKRMELAKRSGVSYPYLSELENGTKQGSTQKIGLIAEALGMTTSQLMARAEALAMGSEAPAPYPQFPSVPGATAASASGHGEVAQAAGVGGAALGAPSAGGIRSLRPLAPVAADTEAIVVERVTRLVRAEIERWLDTELEPLVREQVRQELRRDQ